TRRRRGRPRRLLRRRRDRSSRVARRPTEGALARTRQGRRPRGRTGVVSEDRIYVDGELFLSVETVAEIYRVEVVWLREVVESGLLGGDAAPRAVGRIAAVRLDRLAAIVRLHHVL